MKMKTTQILLVGAVFAAVLSARGQVGPGGAAASGISLSGSTAKLFGENNAFTATMEMQAGSAQGPVVVPGKLAYLEGKSRFEMDTTEAKSSAIPPGAAAQMKAMGMDKIIVISRPDKKVTYMIYPGLKAYVEMPLQDADSEKSDSDFKMESTEIGKESLVGHECVKNKVVVTDKDGSKHEKTVWNAPDLNKFPVKIEQTEGGNLSTMTFKDVKLSKPDAKQFDPPTDFKKYDNIMALMQEEVMKRAAGAGAPK
jgi:Domain of unknown function (DUF4412)